MPNKFNDRPLRNDEKPLLHLGDILGPALAVAKIRKEDLLPVREARKGLGEWKPRGNIPGPWYRTKRKRWNGEDDEESDS